MTILEIIRMIGEEFVDLPDNKIEWWVEYVKPFVSEEKFGTLYDRAVAMLTCHRLKMYGYGDDELGEIAKIGRSVGSAGIGSISDGGSSVSFTGGQNVVANSDAELAQTKYGQQFLTMRRMVIVPLTIRR